MTIREGLQKKMLSTWTDGVLNSEEDMVVFPEDTNSLYGEQGKYVNRREGPEDIGKDA